MYTQSKNSFATMGIKKKKREQQLQFTVQRRMPALNLFQNCFEIENEKNPLTVGEHMEMNFN